MRNIKTQILEGFAQQKLALRGFGAAPHWIALAALTASVAMSGLAYQGLRDMVAAASTLATKERNSVSAEKRYLKVGEYATYINALSRLSPNVKFEAGKDGQSITISINKEEFFVDWMYAVQLLMSERRTVFWEATKVCLKKCEGPAAVAHVRGYEQTLTIGSDNNAKAKD